MTESGVLYYQPSFLFHKNSESFARGYTCTDVDGNSMTFLTEGGGATNTTSSSGSKGYFSTGTYIITFYFNETSAAVSNQDVETVYQAVVTFPTITATAIVMPTVATPVPMVTTTSGGVLGGGLWSALELGDADFLVLSILLDTGRRQPGVDK